MMRCASSPGSGPLEARRAATPLLLLALLVAGAPPAARLGAQGTLGTQGYGYPQGGLSMRAAAAGGALAEFDAVTPHNPAAIGGLARPVLTMQAEPERRTITVDGTRERTTVQRVPLAMLVLPLRQAVAVSVGFTTLLDRTASTRSTGVAVVDGDSLSTQDRGSARGALNDLRLGVGWRVGERLAVGVGGHLFTGANLVGVERRFADSLRFGAVSDSSRLVFSGTALSVGGEWRVGRGVSLGGSWRRGNRLEAAVGDSVVGRARAPDRRGVALRYDGVPGSIFAVGVEQHGWSRMAPLGTADMAVRDATDVHAGAEVAGPRLRDVPVLLRVGYARRQLPFGVRRAFADEVRWSAGVGLPVAQERATIDLAVQRANRTLDGSAIREAAWLFGVALQVRP